MKTILLILALSAISCSAATVDKLKVVLGGDQYLIPVSDNMILDLRIALPKTKHNVVTMEALGFLYHFTIKNGGVEVVEEESSYAGPAKSPQILTSTKSYRLEPGRSLLLASGYEMAFNEIAVTEAQ